ncbi:MAG TPA: succinate dehydrogenase cytochrome b subunit [Geobacterales bacterium]|nr:succinate dehydrogenase cytochrome b subunit [Geobacterales bacterium]
MHLFTSTVGRKILMAISGQLMVLFVVVHLLGNSSIFIGPNGINAYAEHLHSLGPLVWVFRAIMLGLVATHILFGSILSIENSQATPRAYSVKKYDRSTLGSRTMIWTGLLLLAFITYHILHFTARIMPDTVGTAAILDAEKRFDVYNMVTTSFKAGAAPFIYMFAMLMLFLHLSHGIQSFFQTMGWNTENTLPKISALGKLVAVVLLIGYASIPFVILSGILFN